jgi:hypothetical protein
MGKVMQQGKYEEGVMSSRVRAAIALGACACAAVAYAATALRFGAEINVSRTAAPTEKAKVVRLAYLDGAIFRKVWLVVYAEGPFGRQDVTARYSFDEGASWSEPRVISTDAAGVPTGGQTFSSKGDLRFIADNDKPTVFAAPTVNGPSVVVTWNSSYCPPAAAAGRHAGSYANPDQGVGDFDLDGTPDRPFHCVWVATTTDPSLRAWDVQQLTHGVRDAINETVAGNATGTAFAMTWQEDPAGLQPGEGEGRGDGGMGSSVSAATNIWYTHAPSLSGATLRANVAQLSDNNSTATGQAGASRPNLQLSGSTAVLAYEESGCPGGGVGKCIVFHSFPYNAHDVNYAGTIVSDVTQNARRVRVFLQGASAAGPSSLRAVVLWRQTPFVTPAAPSDIFLRRGLVDAAARPGSTGLLASDLLADPPQNMTKIARFGGNANAHRAVVRGNLVVLAYDQTADMDAANPEKTLIPTANYNLYVTRSTASGEAGSWSQALNLSRVSSPELTVVEPRMVPTPGTVINPLTGTPDDGDRQDPAVLLVSYATERNTLAAGAGRVYVARSVDQAATFEPFMPVSSAVVGQSEAQLRPSPDGATVSVLWMGEQTPGDEASKDAVLAIASFIRLPDLRIVQGAVSFPAYSNVTLPLTIVNGGSGSAASVRLAGVAPAGVNLIGISDAGVCAISGQKFECTFLQLASSAQVGIGLTVSSAIEGSHVMAVEVSSGELDADATDNAIDIELKVTAPLSSLPPVVVNPPPPPAGTPGVGAAPVGGGGSVAGGPASGAFAFALLLLAALKGRGRAVAVPGRSARQARPEARSGGAR